MLSCRNTHTRHLDLAWAKIFIFKNPSRLVANSIFEANSFCFKFTDSERYPRGTSLNDKFYSTHINIYRTRGDCAVHFDFLCSFFDICLSCVYVTGSEGPKNFSTLAV